MDIALVLAVSHWKQNAAIKRCARLLTTFLRTLETWPPALITCGTGLQSMGIDSHPTTFFLSNQVKRVPKPTGHMAVCVLPS